MGGPTRLQLPLLFRTQVELYMSTILDVYLHGSVHLTNPGLEELLADTLSQGVSRSLLGPKGPGG